MNLMLFLICRSGIVSKHTGWYSAGPGDWSTTVTNIWMRLNCAIHQFNVNHGKKYKILIIKHL
jgi:hypothetical protein